jgi:LPP20 lipoprotein
MSKHFQADQAPTSLRENSKTAQLPQRKWRALGGRSMAFSLSAAALLSVMPAAQAAPAWLSQIEQEYPRTLFLSGVGSADNVEMARQRAISTIAQSVRVQVKSNLQSNAEQSSVSTGGKTRTTESQRVVDSSELSSELELPGAEMVKMDFDQAEKQHYALAVIDKRKLEIFWRDKIKSLSTDAQSMLEQAQSSTTSEPLQAFQLARRALAAVAQARDYAQNMGSVAGAAGRSSAEGSTASLAALNAQAQQSAQAAKSKIRFYVVAEQTPSRPLQAALLESLTQQGLRVLQGAGAADKSAYRIKYTLELQSPFRRDESWWQLGQVLLELEQNEQTLSKLDFPIKAASGSPQLLSQRVQKMIGQNLADKLPGLICSDCPSTEGP